MTSEQQIGAAERVRADRQFWRELVAEVGRKRMLEPGPSADTPYEAQAALLPKTLREATESLDKSKMLRAALGDAVIDHYVHTAKWEQFEYDRRITDWELMRGFERY